MLEEQTLSFLASLHKSQLSELIVSPIDWSAKLIFLFGYDLNIKEIIVDFSSFLLISYNRK